MERTFLPAFEDDLSVFLESVNAKYNCDFRQYAPRSMRRTIINAMNKMDSPSLRVLQERVLANPTCFYDLIQILTIPVSEVFRDPSYYRSLRQAVMPHLKTYPSLKIWVAGCSTGEEVISLAILLAEEGLLERTIIYATDINPRSLETAQAGDYPVEEIRRSTSRHEDAGGTRPLADYYTIVGDKARFTTALTERVTFTDHSLATDAVFSETHLISCRNVLIYFDRKLQDRVFRLFHESLCRKGFLGLGSKETVQFSTSAKAFDTFVKEDRIFQKN